MGISKRWGQGGVYAKNGGKKLTLELKRSQLDLLLNIVLAMDFCHSDGLIYLRNVCVDISRGRVCRIGAASQDESQGNRRMWLSQGIARDQLDQYMYPQMVFLRKRFGLHNI